MSTFSHSRISTFENCPKQYEFTYVLGAPRGADSVEAFMGSRVHEALEWLYEQVRLCRLPSEDDTAERFLSGWAAEWSDDIRVVRSDRTPEDYRQIGEKAVRDYHRRHHPFDRDVTVGLECRVSLKLDERREIVGYIDRLAKVSDGVWEIHDYKTSNTLMTQQHADADRQLALYALAVREMYPDARDITLVWHYLAFDHEVRSFRTTEQLESLRRQVLEAVVDIESRTEFPTKVSTLCDWCDHQRTCPAWSHKFEAASLPVEQRTAEEGTALVDEYLSVTEEIGRLKLRQEWLRDEIASFSSAKSIERVFGTAGSLKVYRFPQISVPDSKDPVRAELEGVLKREGLWERLSTLSPYSLSRAIQDGQVTGAQLSAIEPYLERSEGVRLYVSRGKPAS